MARVVEGAKENLRKNSKEKFSRKKAQKTRKD
jgi:hypothetical protein